jgi:hypothetical protein
MAWKIVMKGTEGKKGQPNELAIYADGLKIARRGHPGTSDAGKWVSVEPGWEVKDALGMSELWVRYTDPKTGEVISFPPSRSDG